MARKPRIDFEGALYHVITRGNHQEPIFRDTEDYLRYLDTLCRYKSRYPFALYAFALMRNHVHLLIEIKETPLSKILQGINLCYALYFNRENKTIGHLFQGRYKAFLCDKDRYFLALIRYIHLNPVRAGIASHADAYPWTSHHAYAGAPSHGSAIVDSLRTLTMFSDDIPAARKHYLEFMNEVRDDADIMKIDDRESKSRVMRKYVQEDNERAISQVKSMQNRIESTEIRTLADGNVSMALFAHNRGVRKFALEEIARKIETLYGVSRARMQSRCNGHEAAMGARLFTLVAKEFAYSGNDIANFVGKDPAVITRHMRHKCELEHQMHEVIASLSQKSQT